MVVQSAEQLIARPPTKDDIPELVALLQRYTQAQFGITEVTEKGMQEEWQTPGFNPQTDVHTIWTPDGRAVGYVETWTLGDPPIRNGIWFRVDPEYYHYGLGEQLLAWGEARVRQILPQVDKQLQVEASVFTRSTETYIPDLLKARGYQLARSFWRMQIELDQPIPEPTLPEGVIIRPYDPVHEFVGFVQAKDEAFRDHYGYIEEPLESLLKRWEHWRSLEIYDPSLWFVAVDGDEIAAVAACYKYIDEAPDFGWVGTLAVRQAWRKQGLGLALLHHAFRAFQQRGQAYTGLSVDSASLTGATRLYERAGMHISIQSDNYLKVLRPGNIISRQ